MHRNFADFINLLKIDKLADLFCYSIFQEHLSLRNTISFIALKIIVNKHHPFYLRYNIKQDVNYIP